MSFFPSAMTVALALKYASGVLLASDTLVMSNNAESIGKVLKMAKLRENCLIAYAGSLGVSQYLLRDLAVKLVAADNLLVDHLKNCAGRLEKENPKEWEKVRGLSELELFLYFSKENRRMAIVNDGQLIVRLTGDNIPEDFSQPLMMEKTALYEVCGKDLLMNVETVVATLQNQILSTNSKEATFLAVGYDRSGFQIHFVDTNAGKVPMPEFYAIGSSSRYALSRCSLGYRPEMSFEQAVDLAAFALSGAGRFDVGVNLDLQIAHLQVTDEEIEAKFLNQRDVQKAQRRAKKLEEKILGVFYDGPVDSATRKSG